MAAAAAAANGGSPRKDVAECAVCFDDIAPEDAVSLPCKCTVAYCQRCWDRSLSASVEITESSRPQCPTCRCPLLVGLEIVEHAGAGAQGIGASTNCKLVFEPAEDTHDKRYWRR